MNSLVFFNLQSQPYTHFAKNLKVEKLLDKTDDSPVFEFVQQPSQEGLDLDKNI